MFSFNDYIRGELRRGYELEEDEQRHAERRQKFYTFLRVPIEFERFMFQAFFQILDAFLFVFTLLPIRFLLSCWFTITRSLRRLLGKFFLHQRHPGLSGAQSATDPRLSILQPAEICDLLRGSILICAITLISYVDTSILYHNIKSQSVIKLYIFFNMLEVFDKLMSAFGCDIMDALFWTATEPRRRDKSKRRFGVLAHLLAAIVYVLFHSLLVLVQATTLNVALNSKNKALLTIMMSNNFVELKGMVFKKFEKNNLFHMSCSDVRERHHFLILIMIVMMQTLKEYNWNEEQLYVLLPDCLLILAAEMIVDWLKHAFVTRFNEITSEVYQDYTITLAYDLMSSKLQGARADHTDLIARRMGFIPLPLAVLVVRVFAGSLTINWWQGYLCLLLGYLCLLTFKIAINIILLAKSFETIERERKNSEHERHQKQGQETSSILIARQSSSSGLQAAVAAPPWLPPLPSDSPLAHASAACTGSTASLLSAATTSQDGSDPLSAQ